MAILLWVIPILITIIVSFLCAKKYIMKPKLKCYILEIGSIFSKKIGELPKLKIIHNGVEITDEIVSLKMLIVNIGICDIEKNMVIKPISIVYNNPLEILDVKFNGNNIAEIDFDKNNIVVKWDLLKKNEGFIIEVLLKHDKIDNLEEYINNFVMLKKHMKINSRIVNLDKPKIEKIQNISGSAVRICVDFIFILFYAYISYDNHSWFVYFGYLAILSFVFIGCWDLEQYCEYKKIKKYLKL